MRNFDSWAAGLVLGFGLAHALRRQSAEAAPLWPWAILAAGVVWTACLLLASLRDRLDGPAEGRFAAEQAERQRYLQHERRHPDDDNPPRRPPPPRDPHGIRPA